MSVIDMKLVKDPASDRTAADRTHRGGHGGHGDGETLRRHGEIIYRVEPDGSMRGSFQSK